ncbi:DUF5067 domain-containing protein [Enterococcus sp. LJL128]
MKKGVYLLGIVVLFVLSACSSGVSEKDLMKNDWKVAVGDETPSMVLAFTEKTMTFTPYMDEDEDYGEFGDELISSIQITMDYKLSGNTLHVTNEDMAIDNKIKLTKKGDGYKLVNTSKDSSKEFETLNDAVLTPYDKKSDDSSSEKAADSSTEESTKEKTKQTTETSVSSEAENAPADSVAKATIEDDTVKLTITKVDFFQNMPSYTKDKGLVVVYYTIENTGTENFEPLMKVLDYLYVTEEDDVSKDSLAFGGHLFSYKLFDKLDANSRLNIKPGAKIDGVVDFAITGDDKDITVSVGDELLFSVSGENSIASETFTAADVAKAFKKNANTKPK